MEDNTLVESSVSATINAPIENVNIPAWCFTLAESEYQACSPAHYSAGTTTAPDGRRMSINVTTCEFTNTVHSSATPELLEFLGKQGIPFDIFRAARRPMSEAHNRQETPLFAESIGRHAMARHGEAVAS